MNIANPLRTSAAHIQQGILRYFNTTFSWVVGVPVEDHTATDEPELLVVNESALPDYKVAELIGHLFYQQTGLFLSLEINQHRLRLVPVTSPHDQNMLRRAGMTHHHTAMAKDYIRVGETLFRPYSGKFGDGYTIHTTAYPQTTRFHNVDYFITRCWDPANVALACANAVRYSDPSHRNPLRQVLDIQDVKKQG